MRRGKIHAANKNVLAQSNKLLCKWLKIVQFEVFAQQSMRNHNQHFEFITPMVCYNQLISCVFICVILEPQNLAFHARINASFTIARN
jgi:hypothetical protein